MATAQPKDLGASNELLSRRYVAVDGHNVRQALNAGLTWLRTHQQVVNSLNVFPVPDGDTGTNMALTMQAAWEEIESHDSASASTVAHSIAQGALMGARGNSGVILSQLWRGFARAVDGRDEIDAHAFVKGLVEARDTAYKGVVRPVEGTILTVSKDVAAAAEAARADGAESVLEVLEQVVEAAEKSVERTPELLPVLREAGVVDAGGKGLFFILEGMLRAAYRLPLDEPAQQPVPLEEVDIESAAESVEPGQDWEIVVDFRPGKGFDLSNFYERLEQMGTSIQVGEGDGLYRMHIHVPENTQYEPIEYIRGLGTITQVHLENLMDQVSERIEMGDGADYHLNNIQPGQIAIVAVSPGSGIARVFAGLGAAAIIEGGQTMNPSTEEIMGSFENLSAQSIIVLPNNENIHLAAAQARDLTVKQIRVLPTRSVPQGVAAMFEYDPDGDLDAVADSMSKAIDTVTTGELTRATRSVEIDGVRVEQGEVIGLLEGKLIISGEELRSCLFQILEQGGAGEAEIVALYRGTDVSHQKANELADEIRQHWPDLEVELIDGGQPHYDFIISIE